MIGEDSSSIEAGEEEEACLDPCLVVTLVDDERVPVDEKRVPVPIDEREGGIT